VFIVDKNGQLIAASGETDNLDTTSLASLTAGNIAATGGMAKLLGRTSSARSSTRARRRTSTSSSWGTASSSWSSSTTEVEPGPRAPAREEGQRGAEHIFEALLKKVQEPGRDPFAEITDDDIDNLFND
jgi:hypothetical protein